MLGGHWMVWAVAEEAKNPTKLVTMNTLLKKDRVTVLSIGIG